MHRGEGEDVKRIDPFDYYPIKRFFVPFGNKLNSFNKLHSLRSCNFVNSFNLFPNCTQNRLIRLHDYMGVQYAS